ncbi:uncharacterized protein LOC109861875 isoform X2 [Pseudomyrmex gracilis]|uniref:uncharacterized protein LOC109861875 isoform X2 n=1 Tax=Pseudomyrmex gracilis TaxID=219809 RepID=UPI0009950023|nr:uncharacterized protein LOC109861875 isoform X2 [Pseudomyrmex gracilis]
MKKIKRKGGAEKLRDKEKKKLEDKAKKCKSISQMFFQAVQAEETRSDRDNHLQEAMIQTETENNEKILIDTADAERILDVPNDNNEVDTADAERIPDVPNDKNEETVKDEKRNKS